MGVKQCIRIDLLAKNDRIDEETNDIFQRRIIPPGDQHTHRDIGLPAVTIKQNLCEGGQDAKGCCAIALGGLVNQLRCRVAKCDGLKITGKAPFGRTWIICWQV